MFTEKGDVVVSKTKIVVKKLECVKKTTEFGQNLINFRLKQEGVSVHYCYGWLDAKSV